IHDLESQIEITKAELVRTQVERTEQQAKVDQDYLDSIMQQHSIDLSNARSQIRNLENKLFEEESKSHEMLTRIENLQDQLRGFEESNKVKTLNHSVNSNSSNLPVLSITEPINISSIPNHSPSLTGKSNGLSVSSSFANTIDERSLSAHTLHQRRQSLNMLKTRMEEELGLNEIS
ncbi:hypothetical protein CROQUDRAFT_21191, partial [Cronartium quercuum f. sp. fusiforme G11]